MANILVDNIKPIYPLPERVQARPTTAIGEVRRTKAPSVLAELGYHDNTDDANWLTGNLDEIAQALSLGVTEYFGLPFLIPGQLRDAVVRQTEILSTCARFRPQKVRFSRRCRTARRSGFWRSMTRGIRSFMTDSTASQKAGTLRNSPPFQPSFPSRRVSMSPSAQPRSFRRPGRRGRLLRQQDKSAVEAPPAIRRSLRYSFGLHLVIALQKHIAVHRLDARNIFPERRRVRIAFLARRSRKRRIGARGFSFSPFAASRRFSSSRRAYRDSPRKNRYFSIGGVRISEASPETPAHAPVRFRLSAQKAAPDIQNPLFSPAGHTAYSAGAPGLAANERARFWQVCVCMKSISSPSVVVHAARICKESAAYSVHGLDRFCIIKVRAVLLRIYVL